MQLISTPSHTITPDRLRAIALGRRIRASESVSALLGELAFGAVRREQADMLPASLGRARP